MLPDVPSQDAGDRRLDPIFCQTTIDKSPLVKYHLTMIESFKHRGLKELHETGKSARVPPDLIARARLRLGALQAATNLDLLKQPGFQFHPLQGKPQRYSIHVNGPWCITFEWEEGKAKRVDLEQYH